jgi:hypothetical protein
MIAGSLSSCIAGFLARAFDRRGRVQSGGEHSLFRFRGLEAVILNKATSLVAGVVASLLGVAGGEFLIPTFVLLFGADIELASSLSLAVSLPTMLVG